MAANRKERNVLERASAQFELFAPRPERPATPVDGEAAAPIASSDIEGRAAISAKPLPNGPSEIEAASSAKPPPNGPSEIEGRAAVPAKPLPIAPTEHDARPAPVNVIDQVPAVHVGPRIYSVGELTREIKGSLEDRYQRVAVQGEISNLSRAASGHIYFTLKDAEATLSAVLFRTQARLLKFELQNGQKVVCRGRITLYPPRGQYQLACDALEPTGLGALAIAFEQLMARLSAEGLFDAARKKVVPVLPRRIGVVTSPQGAAIRDFLRVLHQRCPNLPVLIAPAKVQGDGAAFEIARALRMLGRYNARVAEAERVDVVVVTRGGGSIEDLWAFNEEVVARAIAACELPVVSAVGHEVDFTIADFVADLRCPTPTAAAERLAPELRGELHQLQVRARRLHKAVERVIGTAAHALAQRLSELGDPRRELSQARIALDDRADAMERAHLAAMSARREHLARAKERVYRAHPRQKLAERERALRGLDAHLHAVARRNLAGARAELQGLRERLAAQLPTSRIQREQRHLVHALGQLAALQRRTVHEARRGFDSRKATLDALSPLAVMSRGYAIAFDASGRALRTANAVQPGEPVRVRLAEGDLDATVTRVRPPRG